MYAKVLVATLSLCVTFVITSYFYSPISPAINIASGQADFGKYCARCHSLEPNLTNYGPSLSGIAEVASQRVPDQSAEEYLWRSLLYPQEFTAGEGAMPSNLAAELGVERSRNIVAFLLRENPARDYPNLLQLSNSIKFAASDNKSLDLRLADIEAGRELFFGKHKCATCHKLNPVHPQDHLAAPSLEGVGLNDEQYLIESIRNPAIKIVPGYKSATALHFGNVLAGRLVFSSDEKVTLLTGSDVGWQPIEVPLVGPDADEVLAWKESETPIMPPYDEAALSTDELRKLLAFLKSLR